MREGSDGGDLQAALDVSRGSLRGVRPDQSGGGREGFRKAVHAAEARDLKAWAQRNGRWIPERDFDAKWEEGGKRGESEHQVYFDPSTQRWWKRNTLNFHDGSIGAYLERLAAHGLAFPETAPRFEGFTTHRSELMPVISQVNVRGEMPSDTQIRDALLLRGFKEVFEAGVGMAKAHRLAVEAGLKPPPLTTGRRLGFYLPGEGIWLEDVHDENAKVARNEALLVFDPVMYYVGDLQQPVRYPIRNTASNP